ncbi:DNA primase [Pseudoflavonifractor sp. MSJ-37]|uniref:DNA primase n=1 Tax=Pseudoflavonifractor sp. MSJ-37 TaxID=2841531 RepID=UPI001C128FBA|nr:DNA primase [Pseudoflavonifractor sp. MSJ-37]MBU5434597.1 DNA primase [Pseudoflavonifractor sp. MSJ-37]
MAIPEAFIDEVVARNEISDVVSSYVHLTRKGNNMWGLCPFHNEKTPSFSVSTEKQIYHCFGCGKGGGVISFIMEIENLPFVEAVRLLAQRAGLEMPESGENEGWRRRKERLLTLNKEAARFFHETLKSPAGAAGAAYLFQKRGLSRGIVTRFGLGMAPDRWDSLIQAMAEKGYSKRELLDAGLAVDNKKGRIYDRFRNRVMFPIIDLRGEVIGFGGRVLDDSTPKYLNSPDTVIYNKSRNLFALNIAKKSKLGRIILTEGYMDTISLHQAGFDCAVASLGTSLTQEHAQLLSRYTKEAVIAYDGDGAGVKAAQRAIPILEKTGIQVKVLQIRGAKDPDEYIKKYGREAFAKMLDQSENHIEYRLRQIQGKYDLTDDAQKVEFLREAAAMLATLPSPVEREIYGGRAAEAAGVTPAAMEQEVKRELSRRIRQAKKQQERRDLTPAVQLQPKEYGIRYPNMRSGRAEEGVLRLMLLEPSLFRETGSLTAEQFSAPLLGRIYSILLRQFREGRTPQAASLAGDLSPEEMSFLSGIMGRPESLANSRQALRDYINVIQTEAVKRSGAGDGAEDPLLTAMEKFREKKAYGG